MNCLEDDELQGEDVLICIIDTGVDAKHKQLKDLDTNDSRVIYEKIYFAPSGPLPPHAMRDFTPMDLNDHGTWCATASAGGLIIKRINRKIKGSI